MMVFIIAMFMFLLVSETLLWVGLHMMENRTKKMAETIEHFSQRIRELEIQMIKADF